MISRIEQIYRRIRPPPDDDARNAELDAEAHDPSGIPFQSLMQRSLAAKIEACALRMLDDMAPDWEICGKARCYRSRRCRRPVCQADEDD